MFALHLTQTHVWTMIIVVREIMEVNYPPPKGSGLLLNGSPD